MFKKLFKNYRIITILWFIAAIVPVLLKYFKSGVNNYWIFKGVFWHTIQQLPLYIPYPEEYTDTNHYGVFFSAIIAPFAVLPDFLGVTLWVLFNAFILYVVLRKLPLRMKSIIIIMLISVHELYGASDMQQFNTGITALIVLSYILIEKGKEQWGTLSIVTGFLTKIYGIVGLAFFPFSKNKFRFIWSGLLWLGVGFALPMLYSSPEYVISQYQDWMHSITEKNDENLFSIYQNISLIGFLFKTGIYKANTIWIIFSGAILFAIPYLRFSQYKYPLFRMQFLASVLLFLVLFSSGSESSTYIVAYIGIGIWYVTSPNPYSKLKNILLILAILASLSITDFENSHLLKSKKALEEEFGVTIKGLRMPRMAEVSDDEVEKAGYTYNSSINPTYLPGRYKKNHVSRKYFKTNGVWQIPTAVSTWFRVPLFWLSFHNFPLKIYKWLVKKAIKSEDYAVLYFHPWEFTDLDKKEYNFPFYVRRNTGEKMVSRFEKLLKWIQKNDIKTEVFGNLVK